MFRLSVRNLFAKKFRLVTTMLAVVIGVAFTTGTMILADTMSASFSTAIDDISDGVDTVVRGREIGQSDLTTTRAPVDVAALDRIRAMPGVAAAEPFWQGYAQVVGEDGKALDSPASIGVNWVDDPELSIFELIDGRPPSAVGEIALAEATAGDAGVETGDRVDVVTALGREEFVVTGLAVPQGGTSLGNTSFTFFGDSDAAARLAAPGDVDAIVARSDDTLDEAQLTAAIAAAVPDADVVTGSQDAAEQKADLDQVIGVLETILLVFGLIALFVGSFTIANTFTITIAQRTRELALVRAVGASRRQILGSVVVEALVLGALAAGLGFAAGVGVAHVLTAVLGAVGLEFPAQALVVQSSTAVVAFVASLVVTVGAAVLPARRAATVAPVAAMRDGTSDASRDSRRRIVFGGLVAAVAAAALAGGVAERDAALVGVAAVTALAAAVALGPILVGPVAAVLGVPMRCLGAPGRLAAANAVRNPRRSAATAASLTIGVMLVAGAAMFAATARATVVGDVSDTIVADRVVQPVGAAPGVPAGTAGQLATIPGARVLPARLAVARVGADITPIAGIDIAAASGLVELDVVAGTLAETPGGLVVGDRTAKERGWDVGDQVDVQYPDAVTASGTVTAIVRQTNALPAVIVRYADLAPHVDDLDAFVLVGAATSTLDEVGALLAATPTAELVTVEEYAATQAAALDVLLSLVLGFLGLAVVIAVLGIATTIGLSVHERTRELGTLRAIGMTGRQLRRSIRLESIVIALFGTAIGLVLGIGLTAALLRTLEDDGFTAPVTPTATLGGIVVGALVAGTVAAALPARRAARTPVLDAIRRA